MNTEIIPTEQKSAFGEGVKSVVDNVKSKATDNLEVCEDKVRQSPGKAVLIAFGTGYILNRLPVAGLLAVPLRLTAVLAKPALLVLGAAKLYDIVAKPPRD
ncbi:MAG: hypothetical protein ABJQ29_13175 [Luteolibacter sp.]